ncbi:hypothetical protein HanPSC8_Chr16g0744761 [Helianthus annuus]|nr:hypothetical protein HanPSC8_Chr16g0744761 [Helianthus annuus]
MELKKKETGRNRKKAEKDDDDSGFVLGLKLDVGLVVDDGGVWWLMMRVGWDDDEENGTIREQN